MELRYNLVGIYYIPQYKLPDGEWKDFKNKNIKGTHLEKLCIAIGNLQLPRRWENGSWHFTPTGDQKTRDMSLIFTTEMYVMAFLGAAKSHFDSKPRGFNLKLDD